MTLSRRSTRERRAIRNPLQHGYRVIHIPARRTASGERRVEPGKKGSAAIVFVQDGNIVAWDEAAGRGETIYIAGDVTRVELSDDGELVAFVRISIIESDGGRRLEDSSPGGSSDGRNRARGEAPSPPASCVGDWGSPSPRASSSLRFNGFRIRTGCSTPSVFPIPPFPLACTWSMWIPWQRAEIMPTGDSVVFMPSPDGAYIGLMRWPEPVPSFPRQRGVRRRRPGALPSIARRRAQSRPGWTEDSAAFLVREFEPSGQRSTIWRSRLAGPPSRCLRCAATGSSLRPTEPSVSAVLVPPGARCSRPGGSWTASSMIMGPLAVLPRSSGSVLVPGQHGLCRRLCRDALAALPERGASDRGLVFLRSRFRGTYPIALVARP